MIEEHQSPYFKNESEVLQHYAAWTKEHATVYKALQKLGVISKTRSVFSGFNKSFPASKIKHKSGRKDGDLNTQAIRFEQTFYEHILHYKKELDSVDERFVRGIEHLERSIRTYEIDLPGIQERRMNAIIHLEVAQEKAKKAGLAKLEFKVWYMRQGSEPPTLADIAKKLKKHVSTCKTSLYRAKDKMDKMDKQRRIIEIFVDQKEINSISMLNY